MTLFGLGSWVWRFTQALRVHGIPSTFCSLAEVFIIVPSTGCCVESKSIPTSLLSMEMCRVYNGSSQLNLFLNCHLNYSHFLRDIEVREEQPGA
jgi:hypothetical protein